MTKIAHAPSHNRSRRCLGPPDRRDAHCRNPGAGVTGLSSPGGFSRTLGKCPSPLRPRRPTPLSSCLGRAWHVPCGRGAPLVRGEGGAHRLWENRCHAAPGLARHFPWALPASLGVSNLDTCHLKASDSHLPSRVSLWRVCPQLTLQALCPSSEATRCHLSTLSDLQLCPPSLAPSSRCGDVCSARRGLHACTTPYSSRSHPAASSPPWPTLLTLTGGTGLSSGFPPLFLVPSALSGYYPSPSPRCGHVAPARAIPAGSLPALSR